MRGSCGLPQVVNRVIQTLQSGSVAQVEAPMIRGRIPLQGSGGPFVRSGGAERMATTKGLTGISHLYGVPVRNDLHRSFGEVVMWSHATGAGALAACGDVLTAIADVRLAHAG